MNHLRTHERRATPTEIDLARRAIYHGGDDNVRAFRALLNEAMWDGSVQLLDDLAPCRCCCHEHTFESCPARLWHSCRGQGSMTYDDERSWLQHYVTYHGMTEDQFYGYEVTQ